MKELIKKTRIFAQHRDWEQFHSPKNLAMALSVEVAEIVEHFQWLSQAESNRLEPAKLAAVREEIADVMIYLTRLADRLGIDPVQAAEEKMQLNEKNTPSIKLKAGPLNIPNFSRRRKAKGGPYAVTKCDRKIAGGLEPGLGPARLGRRHAAVS